MNVSWALFWAGCWLMTLLYLACFLCGRLTSAAHLKYIQEGFFEAASDFSLFDWRKRFDNFLQNG
jgi:hypothetical protein